MNFPQNTLPIQNITDTGEVPKSRVADAADGQTIVSNLVYANRARSLTNAKVKGQFDGNPPYNPEKLRAAGQSGRMNVNCGEAKASLRAALVPFYDLFAGASVYCQVQTSLGSPSDREKFSEGITDEVDDTLKDYHGFDFNIQQMLNSFLGFGKGFLMWADKTDWKFRCVPHSRVFVPDGTDATMDNLEVLVVRESMHVDRLYKFIRDRSAAESAGWNIQPTVNAISNACPKYFRGDTQYDYEFLQQVFKDKDLTEGTRSSTVQLAHIFVKEFSGKVSHLIVLESFSSSPTNQTTVAPGTQQKVEYLFEDLGCYDEFFQAISAFFLETLDGSWNGATGLGHDIYSLMAVKDRLKCSAIDLTFLRTGINLQAKTANALQQTSIMQLGPLNIIPPDYEVQQATILGDVKSAVDADIYLDNVLANNTGVYRQREQKSQGNPITATQAQFDAQNSVTLSNSAINRFYNSLDKMYKELVRRLCMDREFRSRIVERGIPIEALSKIKSVRAYRNMGNGSVFMRKQAIMQTSSIVPMLPESGRQAWIDMAISSSLGHAAVDLLNPKPDQDNAADEQHVIAALQVGNMKVGIPAVVADTQNPVIFAQTFLQAGAQAFQSLEQGAQPHDVLAFLQLIGPAIGAHLERLRNDPTRREIFNALTQQWQKLAQLTDQLTAHTQAQDKAQAQQQEEMKAAQAKAAAIADGTDPDVEIKRAQATSDMQLKSIKTKHAMDLKDLQTRQKLSINDAMAANKIETAEKPQPANV